MCVRVCVILQFTAEDYGFHILYSGRSVYV